MNSKVSDTFQPSKGVPQRSVLAPLLYNLYVSGLADIAQQFGTSLPSFADDMTMFCSSKIWHETCSTV